MPENNREEVKFDVEGVRKTSSDNPDGPKYTEKTVNLPSSETQGYTPDVDAEFERNCKIVADTLGKYKQWKNDPEGYISLLGGLVQPKLTGTLAQMADNLNFLRYESTDIVRMPKYMQYEDQKTLSTALNAIKTTLGNVTGQVSTNYDLLRSVYDNDVRDGGTVAKRVAKGIMQTLGKDMLKKEFEKSRLSPALPASLAQGSMYQVSGKNGTLGGAILGSLWDMVSGKGDIKGGDVIYNQAKISEDSRAANYTKFADPYLGGNAKKLGDTIADVQKFLSDAGYMAGYKDYAGFELGSNHLWKTEIYPYKSKHGDTCTPPLPAYYLPALWTTSDRYDSSRPKSDILLNALNLNWDYEIQKTVARLEPNEVKDLSDKFVNNLISNLSARLGFKSSSNRAIGNEWRQFSFSRNCPVVSYDLNFGTMRTEAQQLFNGSAIEIFSGMQYNATLNLSIIDDVYQSMHKYWTHYINSIYDINTHSIAPYYNMAFEIVLTIFRSAYKINQKYRFIAVPIEYTPRLDGQQDPTEARIDMTFGIIGLIQPDGKSKNLYRDENISRGQSVNTRYGMPAADNEVQYTDQDPSELTWQDIMINMGNNEK
jgi:hypothetical protein